MSYSLSHWNQEPTIAVGLLDRRASATIALRGSYRNGGGTVGPGELRVSCRRGQLCCEGVLQETAPELVLEPLDGDAGEFSLEATIGIDFHWEQTELQSFRGTLRVIAEGDDRLTVINDVPLETYITSVICSEMNACSPPAAVRSHAIISRSWLLAQLSQASEPAASTSDAASPHIVWTEREAHQRYDVCADDHCQRYQGVHRTAVPEVAAAIADTRGLVLTYGDAVCDARFSKCCGGVVEEYATAWADKTIPYLTSLADAPDPSLPRPALTDEAAFRAFVDSPSPDYYCNCNDEAVLGLVLNDYDVTTRDFFRWRVRLRASEASELVSLKLGTDVGRIVALEPVQRGPSGRLLRLRIVGRNGSVEIGKELQIRRALSPSHLYSSAFYVEAEGPQEQPEAFELVGAGWGHGVGLCQIGAAVMACRGTGFAEILSHYYPHTELKRLYR